jgi:hypothetical protein
VEQRLIIRFEKRGREFVAVARLTIFRWGVIGKPRSPQHALRVRDRVLTSVKSPRHDPKPVDPGLARLKRRESSVEDRTAAAMQALG